MYLKDASINQCHPILIISSQKNKQTKILALIIACLHYSKNGIVMLTIESLLGHFWLISSKPLIAYHLICLLPRYEPVDSIQNYIHSSKVGQEYSSWKEIRYGVPQGSILSPIFSTSIYVTCFSSWKMLKW